MKLVLKQNSNSHFIAGGAVILSALLCLFNFNVITLLCMLAIGVLIIVMGQKNLMPALIVFVSWAGLTALSSLISLFSIAFFTALFQLAASTCAVVVSALLLAKKMELQRICTLLCLGGAAATVLSLIAGIITILSFGVFGVLFGSIVKLIVAGIGSLLPFFALFLIVNTAEVE